MRRKHVLLKLCVLLIITLLCNEKALAQEFNEQTMTAVNIKSPQTEDFIRSGNVPISPYTGQVALSVPLYTYSDKDFTIPISIGANTSGFQPNKRSSSVGLNWHLSAGGVITRQVQGVPDEFLRHPSVLGDPTRSGLSGFLCGVRKLNELSQIQYEPDQVLFFNVGGYQEDPGFWYLGETSENGFEGEPDIFTFNFMGYQGKFVIGTDGEPKLISPTENFKIDISGLQNQDPTKNVINDSEITITTDDGTIYKFGGTETFLEHIQNMTAQGYPKENLPIITSWYLKQITKTNGRTAKFEYLDDSVEDSTLKTSDPTPQVNGLLGNYIMNKYISKNITEMHIEVDGFFNIVATNNQSSTNGPVYSLVKTAYLHKITVGNAEISFGYSEKEKPFYKDEQFDIGHKSLQLDSIQVIFGYNALHTIDFHYDYLGGAWERMFLVGLTKKGWGVSPSSQSDTYSFEYHNVDNITDPCTTNIDYWCYSNGGNSTSSIFLLPEMKVSPIGDLTYTTSERAPNHALCDVGVLKKITYPTGGYTQFEYEGHDYAKRLERHSSFGFLPGLISSASDAGGARIRKITDFDGKSNLNVREFKYTKDFINEGTQSSGVLLDWPRYFYIWNRDGDGLSSQDVRGRSSSFHKNYLDENYITYSEVTEVINGSMFKENIYSSYETFPDINDPNSVKVVEQSALDDVVQKDLYNNYYGIKLSDMSFARGKLRKEAFYDINKSKVSEVVSEYDPTPLFGQYAAGLIPRTGAVSSTYKIFTFPYNLISKTSHLFTSLGTITESTTYDYNHMNQLASIETIGSDGETVLTKYKYPLDISVGNYDWIGGDLVTNAFKKLIDDHMIGEPYEIIKGKNGKITGASLTEYKIEDNVALPHKLFKLNTSTPYGSIAFTDLSYPIVEYVPGSNVRIIQWGKDANYELEATYDKYDVRENIQQFRGKDNIASTIIWGYRYLYPVAKVRNATLTEVESCFTLEEKTNIANGSYSDFLMNEKLNKIRATLGDAFVSTYTYSSSGLLMTQTDPNGIVTKYGYDSFYRLEKVMDNNGKILNQYFYHNVGDPDYLGNLQLESLSFNISSSASTGGSITPSRSVMYDADETFTITPSSFYKISNVIVDEMSLGALTSYTFSNVTADHTIYVEFEVKTYHIEFGSSEGGSISGSSDVGFFSSPTYTITPLAGYEIKSVNVDGISQGKITSYTFSKVNRNHHIYAVFELVPNLNISTPEVFFSLMGGSSSITLSSNIDWTISSSASWINVSPTSGSGNASILISCGRTKFDRSGSITITGAGITKIISVHQTNTMW